jgi:2-methylisocitrate lyase-like PEP mutase family enzyme
MTRPTGHRPGSADSPADAFRALHHGRRPGDPLVLPNVWDAVSAAVFAEAGFAALATSSSAVAATLGHADGGHTPPDAMFAAVATIARAAGPVPVTADIEDGYGLEPEEIVERLLEAGVVGCNLEDTDQRAGALTDPERQAERLARFRTAAAGRLVLNARVDEFVTGDGNLDAAVDRARQYVRAGADCVYPILMDPGLLPEFTAAVRAPVNALHQPAGPDPRRLGALGAARVTFGGGLHAEATSALQDTAKRLHDLAGGA